MDLFTSLNICKPQMVKILEIIKVLKCIIYITILIVILTQLVICDLLHLHSYLPIPVNASKDKKRNINFWYIQDIKRYIITVTVNVMICEIRKSDGQIVLSWGRQASLLFSV